MTERGRRPTATAPAHAPALVLGCGALARELLELVERNGLAEAVDVRCLPAPLHNRPDQIGPLLDARLAELAPAYERVFVAYADCGTGGAVDRVVERYGVERLPGAHCYAFYAGLESFAEIAAEEPGTFYLTDFLARSFETLVWKGLGLDRHPGLRDAYFGNYRRLVYLSQREDPELLAMARRAADRLGLAFDHRPTGYGQLGTAIARLAAETATPATTASPATTAAEPTTLGAEAPVATAAGPDAAAGPAARPEQEEAA